MRTLILTLSFLSLTACAGTAAHPESPDTVSETAAVTLDVRGMVTASCPSDVETAARTIDGVLAVDASLETRRAVIQYVVGETDPETIRRRIAEQTGFELVTVHWQSVDERF